MSEASDDEYRNLLVGLEQDARKSSEKMLIVLSGGGIAVTFSVFDKLIEGVNSCVKMWLLLGWSMWWLSLLVIMLSFLSSEKAMQTAIQQHDRGDQVPVFGDPWNSITRRLNYISVVFFLLGGLFMTVFVFSVVL